jgi:hypothetical protein
VLDHEPGAEDAPVMEVGLWSGSELPTLWVDWNVLLRLMRDPRPAAFSVQSPGQSKPQPIVYTNRQLHRLQVLACAAAGIVNERACVELKAPFELDADLLRLAERARASRAGGDDNYVLRRGALLHTDVAMLTTRPSGPIGAEGMPGPQQITVWFSDGREKGLDHNASHWELARWLLDRVSPALGRDSMVRTWYGATGAWMQSRDYHDLAHLRQARRLFPNDADILFLSGCEHEAFAGAGIQAARAAGLPAGFRFEVRSDRAELGEAERFFRRALSLNPGLTEARLRLGRVLLLRGRHKEAADELRQAYASVDDDLLRYYSALFLGAAEEALGNHERAAESYARAADLYPTAQSPHLALSALARRRGDREGALREIQRVFDLPATGPERQDPWWTYLVAQARNADRRLEELRRPFLEPQP